MTIKGRIERLEANQPDPRPKKFYVIRGLDGQVLASPGGQMTALDFEKLVQETGAEVKAVRLSVDLDRI